MHLHGRYRLPLGLALPLHELQVRQSIADRLAVLLAQNYSPPINVYLPLLNSASLYNRLNELDILS